MSNNILIVVIVAAMLYYLAGGTGNAASTTQSGADCVAAIQAEYAGQWAEMNQVQRALAGLRAASCEGGR